MPLQLKLKKLDGLSDELKALYKEADGEFVLQVEGIEDTGALKRAHERVKGERDDLKTQLTEAKNQFEESETKLREALAKGDGNSEQIESLRTSYEEKFTRLEDEKKEAIGSRDKFIEKTLVDSKALEMASGIAVEGSAKVLMPHIKSRLAVEKSGDEYNTVILGVDGKPSAATLDDLKTEFTNDAAFAHVIVGSKASGGGAGGGEGGGGASNDGDFGGSREDRKTAIAGKFPELANQ